MWKSCGKLMKKEGLCPSEAILLKPKISFNVKEFNKGGVYESD